jgi:hypothetical protein
VWYSISVENFINAFLLSVLLLSLMRELQEYYATSMSYIDDWAVNNKCCAFSVQRKQWYRAIIVELIPGNQAKVTSIHTNSGYPIGSWDSIISVMTMLWHGWFRVQVVREATNFLLSRIVQTSSGGYPTSFSMGNRVLSQE